METTIQPDREAMSVEELAQAMGERAAFYRFMGSALLHEFTDEQIGQLRAFGDLEADSDETRQAVADIRRYLARAGADPRTDLAVDYARVFLSAGVYDGLTAEPYESVFTSDEHLLMQDARDDVVRRYRRFGVDVDPALRMPEDHLGLELDFMGILAERTAQALAAENLAQALELVEAQRSFLADHVLNWIDDLMEKVDEFAALPLYPALMRLARSFMADDEALLAEVASALR